MREHKMKKKILTIVGSALVAAATVQFAAAAERHHSRKADRLTAGERAVPQRQRPLAVPAGSA
jgi:hypothetical protein